jgi:hypothetical protein
MAITTKALLQKRDVDPEGLYVATTSGFAAMKDGSEGMFVKGRSYRGTENIVREKAELFVEAGTPDSEIPGPYARAVEISEQVGIADQIESAKRFPPSTVIPLERQLVVRVGFKLGGLVGFGGPQFVAGQIVDKSDKRLTKILKDHIEYFSVPSRTAALEDLA